ncbi:MAG: DUF1634 domain-containing protein [Chloroflexi bacterium]|nr:DUF1634 domain-containing protein [Chloroflexota bacterium]
MADPKLPDQGWMPSVIDAPRRRPDLNNWMRLASMIVSSIAFVLMIVGFVWFVSDASFADALLTESARPPGRWFDGPSLNLGLAFMSMGVFALAILPALRVALAFAYYIKERRRSDLLAALAVMAILATSLFLE